MRSHPRRDGHLQRDLGALAETTVTLWCNEVGLIANKVGNDKAGWDLVVEVPQPIQITLDGHPLDQQQVLPPCYIQVKGTDKQNTSIDIKLSNWQRAVCRTEPFFIVVLEYDQTTQVQHAYLVHVWAAQMTRVLQRLREITREQRDAQGQAVPGLHRRTLTVPYRTESVELTRPYGESLLAALMTILQPYARTYAQAKDALFRTVGNPHIRGSFTASVAQVIDASLGLIAQVPVSQLRIQDVRFNVPIDTDLGGEALLTIRPVSSGTCTITLTSAGAQVTSTFELIMPMGIDEQTPPELIKLKFQGSNIDLVVSFSEAGKTTFRLDVHMHVPDTASPVDIRAFSAVARFMSFLVRHQERGDIVHMQIRYPNDEQVEAKLTKALVIDADTQATLNALNAAYTILSHIDTGLDMRASMPQLLAQTAFLCLFADLLHHQNQSLIGIEFSAVSAPDDAHPMIVEPTQVYCCPVAFAVHIGRHHIYCSFVAIGTVQPIVQAGGVARYGLATKDGRFRECVLIHEGDDAPESHAEMLRRAAAPYSDQMPVIIISDGLGGK